MFKHIAKSLWLLLFSVIICCIIYPAVIWAIGQTFFPFQANGSIVNGPDGKPVGSLLIAQPFTKDEYFQPRPSAASYDGGASASSALAPSNYTLRNRVATMLGPIVKYKDGAKAGQLVGPDIESWFQKDQYQGSPSIVAQWADAHNSIAKVWVGADPSHAPFVNDWVSKHAAIVTKYEQDNKLPTSGTQAADLAIIFFETFSKENPGKFPLQVTHTLGDGKTTTSTLEAAKEGSDIQSTFFDMWRQDHADVALQDVPGDMVTTSGSGLDPNITLQNAEFQLDRVAGKWASNTKRDAASVRTEIETILQSNATAPFGGLVGEKMINVLQVNLELRKKFGSPM